MSQKSLKPTNQDKILSAKFKDKNLSREDLELVTALEDLKLDLDRIHNNFNYVTDPILIDSYIYEISSLHMRYSYYIKLCKERGLIAGGF